jgi:hypothetical protein
MIYEKIIHLVIPLQNGTLSSTHEIPAFAGMTGIKVL